MANFNNAHSAPHQPLPRYHSTFVGRTEELAYLSQLIASKTTRLITITGYGGVGKTL